MKVASVCVAVAALFAVAMAQTGPIANTAYGQVRGVYDAATKVNSFKGIPYAASTGGRNRFAPPQPPFPWRENGGLKDATKWGPGCPQYKVNADAPTQQSEDCLHVNVFAPAAVLPKLGTTQGNEALLLPVVVWIHGGGFMEGSNIGPYEVYDGKYVAARSNVVVVSMNYRLGALGFLTDGTNGIPGNMGFLDQRKALEWVQANIKFFGGNPKRVTLWGESAGAMSIGLHMIAPGSKGAPGSAGLFQRAIMESNPLAISYKDSKSASVLGLDTCQRLGCDKCGLQCLQSKPLQQVLDASKAAAASTWNTIEANYKHLLGALLDFTPVVDGNIIPSQVIPALQGMGGTWPVPVITGTNLEEGQTFVFEALTKPLNFDVTGAPFKELLTNPLKALTGDAEFLALKAALALIWGPDKAEKMLKGYTRTTDTDAREPLSRVVTDFLFTCASQQFAMAEPSDRKAWVYQYQHVFSIPSLFKGLIPDRCAKAVCHATELPIVFHNAPVIPNEEHALTDAEATLSNIIIDYFGNFITNGDPNVGKTITVAGKLAAPWPQFEPVRRPVLILGQSDAKPVSAAVSFGQTCKLWDQIGYGQGVVIAPPTTPPHFRAVSESVEADDAEDEVEDEAEDEMEVDAEDEVEDEAEDESDAEVDAEDAADMEDFAEDEAEAERYEFADA